MGGREYFALEKGKELHGYSYDDLIHYGGKGDLAIDVLTAKFDVQVRETVWETAHWGYCKDLEGCNSPCRLRVAKECLAEFEAGDENKPVRLERTYFEREGKQISLSYELRYKDHCYIPIEDVFDMAAHHGLAFEDLIPPRVLLSECVMAIGTDEFVRFMESKGEKKLKDQLRCRDEVTDLIYEICRKNRVTYLNQQPALSAWGKLVSGEFSSDLIQSVNPKEIIFKGGGTATKQKFIGTYHDRFE